MAATEVVDEEMRGDGGSTVESISVPSAGEGEGLVRVMGATTGDSLETGVGGGEVGGSRLREIQYLGIYQVAKVASMLTDPQYAKFVQERHQDNLMLLVA